MKAPSRKVFNDINITPLTDIFLVLLIMMMVIAPMLDAQGLKMSVPSVGESSEVTEEPKTIRLTIDAAGNYLINNEPVQAAQLRQTIKQLAPEFPDGVLIESDPQATHGAMVKAMDAARGAGIDKMAVSQLDSATEGTQEAPAEQ